MIPCCLTPNSAYFPISFLQISFCQTYPIVTTVNNILPTCKYDMLIQEQTRTFESPLLFPHNKPFCTHSSNIISPWCIIHCDLQPLYIASTIFENRHQLLPSISTDGFHIVHQMFHQGKFVLSSIRITTSMFTKITLDFNIEKKGNKKG